MLPCSKVFMETVFYNRNQGAKYSIAKYSTHGASKSRINTYATLLSL